MDRIWMEYWNIWIDIDCCPDHRCPDLVGRMLADGGAGVRAEHLPR